MAWPVDDLTTTHLDAGTDDPELAREEILAAVEKLQEVLAQTITDYALTLMAADSAAAAKVVLGLSTAVLSTRQVIAGDGLTGGGDLSTDRTLTLGTPGSLTQSTANAVTATSHTHSLPAATVSAAGIVRLNNTVTSTATTQAATANAVKVAYDAAQSKAGYTASGDANLTNYPVGTILFCLWESASLAGFPVRNAAVGVKFRVGGNAFTIMGPGTALTGTWRSRGHGSASSIAEINVLVQRVA